MADTKHGIDWNPDIPVEFLAKWVNEEIVDAYDFFIKESIIVFKAEDNDSIVLKLLGPEKDNGELFTKTFSLDDLLEEAAYENAAVREMIANGLIELATKIRDLD